MSASFFLGSAELRPAQRTLLVDGSPAPVGARAFDVLALLVEHRDRVVPKTELLDRAWPGVIVEENNLQVQISTLRKILGPSAIATIPGRGYRLAIEVRAVGDEGRSPSLATVVARSGRGIPIETEALIGREPDLGALEEFVAESRLTTLVGPGGVGKTRVAQKFAHRCLASGKFDGVCWVDLASVTSVDGIGCTVAAASGLSLGEGDANLQLAVAIGHRRTLLVLDNCEHLATGVASLAHVVLEKAPNARLLLTSQVTLKVQGERLCRLQPFALPPANASVEEARGFDAIQLLERRARAASRSYALNESTVGAAIELCSRLDGNALAIEMAAPRVPVLGFGPLLAGIRERHEWLRGASDAPERHRSLHAMLEWSYHLLSGEEQAVLRRLSVFSAGFGIDMARIVAHQEGWSEWTALDALASLAEKSLVQVDGFDEPRYRLLETTRLFAFELLGSSGERESILARHSQAVATLSISISRGRWDDDRERWLALSHHEYPDLQAVFMRAVEQGDTAVVGPVGEALNQVEYVFGVASSIRQRKKVVAALLPAASDPIAKARLWNCLSSWRLVGVEGMSRMQIDEGRVAAWRALNDAFELNEALQRLAMELASCGRGDEARAAMAEARSLEDPAWPLRYRTMYWYYQRGLHFSLGELGLARVATQRYVDLLVARGDTGEAGYGRSMLAELDLLEGQVERSIDTSRSACAILKSTGQEANLGLGLRTLSSGLLLKGEVEPAREAAREAFTILARGGMGHRLLPHAAFYDASERRLLEAAQLLGYSEVMGHHLAPFDQPILARTREMIDRGLEASEREAAYAMGRGLSADQAERLMDEVLVGENFEKTTSS